MGVRFAPDTPLGTRNQRRSFITKLAIFINLGSQLSLSLYSFNNAWRN
jgi:hypothetical protein